MTSENTEHRFGLHVPDGDVSIVATDGEVLAGEERGAVVEEERAAFGGGEGGGDRVGDVDGERVEELGVHGCPGMGAKVLVWTPVLVSSCGSEGRDDGKVVCRKAAVGDEIQGPTQT